MDEEEVLALVRESFGEKETNPWKVFDKGDGFWEGRNGMLGGPHTYVGPDGRVFQFGGPYRPTSATDKSVSEIKVLKDFYVSGDQFTEQDVREAWNAIR